jgi:release factor glutamine methyltransferase
VPTIRDLLTEARGRIPGLDAHVLLTDALRVERSYLLAHPEASISDEQAAQFCGRVERAAAGEPIAYIIGRRAFYDRDFEVTPAVLIPRPETELLLEQALTWAKDRPAARVVDVGTGSGALAVTFAALVPSADVYAVDISAAALDVARRNAERHAARVTFAHGDLLTPFLDRRFDLVMANLPYIAGDVVPTLAVSRSEPVTALDGGADGLDLIRRLIAQVPHVTSPGALILLEIGADQGAAALALAQTLTPAAVEVLPDYAGLDRIVKILR